MIVVRNVFKLKFGEAKQALALWNEYFSDPDSIQSKYRLMTDLVGDFYTMVMEVYYEDLTAFQNESRNSNDPKFGEFYSKFVAITESGYREIFSVVAEN